MTPSNYYDPIMTLKHFRKLDKKKIFLVATPVPSFPNRLVSRVGRPI